MGWAPAELGEHTYELVPQRIGYLDAKLGSLQDILSLDVGEDGSIINALGQNAYGLLKVFIPDLMPEWEWQGYASPAALAEKRYEEEADRSPSVQQIVTAFEGVMAVNKLDLFKKLGEVVGMDFLRTAMRAAIADSVLPSSTTSSPASTAPIPTTSETTDPTAETAATH